MHSGRVLRDIGESPPGRPARTRHARNLREIDNLKAACGLCVSHGIMITKESTMKPVSKRDLVNAAALLPITAIRGTAANSAVKVGLIGSGGRGAFDAGFVDERIEQARKKIPIENPTVYKDYRELLAG